MKRLVLIVITLLICVLSQAHNPPYRNGQRLTGYDSPLSGDVESIGYAYISINPDTGKEYPRDTTTIKFNKNRDIDGHLQCVRAFPPRHPTRCMTAT